MTDIGTLRGYFRSSWATGINDSGIIVGSSYFANGWQEHAFVYNGTTMTDLGILGGAYSEALSINNSGTIVGTRSIVLEDFFHFHGFIAEGTTMTDLSIVTDLSGTDLDYIISATAINDCGDVVGEAITSTGSAHPVLLTRLIAVPEPSSFALFGAFSLLGLVGWRGIYSRAYRHSSLIVRKSALFWGDLLSQSTKHKKRRRSTQRRANQVRAKWR